MAKRASRLGFYSRKSAVMAVDRRSSEAKIMMAVVRGLEDELGGSEKVTFRQQLIIKSTADLVLRLTLAMGRYVRDPDDNRQVDMHVVTLQTQAEGSLIAEEALKRIAGALRRREGGTRPANRRAGAAPAGARQADRR